MALLRAQRFSDGDRLDVAGCPVRLKVDGRARRISLRVDRAKSEVVALAPSPRRLGEAVAFAQEKSAWIAGQLAALPGRVSLAPGGILRLNGKPYRLEAAPGRPRMTEEALIAPDDANWGLKILRLAKREAIAVLTERTAVHAAALGRPMPSVAVADPKARWGSCRPARPGAPAAIRYSWRLILAPAAVADYVAAHECAHLIEANHGPRFWALCEQLIGDPAPHRRWLRAHAAELHAIGA
ncbi:MULTISPECIES: YgjP family zinc-dependent metalloprotease [unclassified Caulobacter]|uniref:YgjP family zinc-dependent metalloprotease n=1 Tax=unclassified Caulobacter TaxID=2648921 RepID=UPI000D33A66E|nr:MULTISPECIES: M48 family metallopeptidase [unclassified Caulobacter]PTS82593.1 metal-dependent hydrolase [Caulobacter sp. HMWF009]PTT12262.1 metal-dependent hydrolase [Caulobacter sp. HMWF025]